MRFTLVPSSAVDRHLASLADTANLPLVRRSGTILDSLSSEHLPSSRELSTHVCLKLLSCTAT